MRRAISPAFLEGLANDPRINRRIGGDGSPVALGDSWERTVAYECEWGGVVFLLESERTYSAHLLFLPGTPNALGKCAVALARLWADTDADEVLGEFPAHYRHVRAIAEGAGMKHITDEAGASLYAISRHTKD